MRTRWRRLLDVDDAEHLRGVAELFNLDGAHINSSPSKVRPLCEWLPTEPTNQRLLPLVAWLLTQRTVETGLCRGDTGPSTLASVAMRQKPGNYCLAEEIALQSGSRD